MYHQYSLVLKKETQ